MSTFTEIWQEVITTQPDPPSWLVLCTGIAALVTVAHPPTWRISRTLITIAHEGGHALVALMTGRQLTGIRLHSDTSGVTVSKGKPTGPGMVATGAAGYVGPPLLGLGASALLASDHITAMLWIVVALLAAMLVMIRNAFGILAVLATGGGIVAISWLGTAIVQAAFAYTFAWFLLLGGVRPVAELQRKRRRRRSPDSDADQLARITGVPGILWVAAFTAIAVGALIVGVAGLLPALPIQ